jgi:hypothetical protein
LLDRIADFVLVENQIVEADDALLFFVRFRHYQTTFIIAPTTALSRHRRVDVL